MKLVGVWDLVRCVGDLVEVVDWKSGAATGDDPEADVQIGAYLLAASEMWPDRPVRVALVYLSHGGPVRVRARPDLLDWHRAALLATAESMRAKQDHPTPGAWCTWCDYQGGCDAATAWLDQAVPESTVAADQLVETRQRLKDLIKLAEARKKSCDAELERRLRGGEEIVAPGWTVSRRSRKRQIVDVGAVSAVAHAMQMDAGKVLELVGRVSVTALAKLVKEHALGSAALDAHTDTRTGYHVHVGGARRVKTS